MSRFPFSLHPDQIRCLCGAWMLRDPNFCGKYGQAQYRCQRCQKTQVLGKRQDTNRRKRRAG